MRLGLDLFYQCSACGALLRNRNLMSGNTHGALYFSDGRRQAPMLPDIPSLTSCPECNAILWINDLSEIDPRKISGTSCRLDRPERQRARYVRNLGIDDLHRALVEVMNCTPYDREREIFVRCRIWWHYNRTAFDSTEGIDAWSDNCRRLLTLLDPADAVQRCTVAELFRNLCRFSDCLRLLDALPEEYNDFKERMREECATGNPKTVRLRMEKKQIEQENYYDVLQNKAGELLFCIGEHEGEPNAPEILYAGGEHALLYRRAKQIIVLDFLHLEICEPLAKAENVLIAEFHKDDRSRQGILREYTAVVTTCEHLPEERGLQSMLPEGGTMEEIAGRITGNIEHNDEMARHALMFYRSLARACHPRAQYLLGELYRDDRFADPGEALRWIQYAALQGYKPAVDALDDFEADDDGRYDAWV